MTWRTALGGADLSEFEIAIEETLVAAAGDPTMPRPKASLQLYANLSDDPMVAEIVRRSRGKRLSLKDMVLIQAAIIAALDQQITDQKNEIARYARELRPWNRAREVFTGPLLGGGTERRAWSGGGGDDGPPDGSDRMPDSSEPHWFLKYLTLRNVLGVLTVSLAAAWAVFAWTNRHHTDLIKVYQEQVAEARATSSDLSEKNEMLKTDLGELKSLVADKEHELDRLQNELDDAAADRASLSEELAALKAAHEDELAVEQAAANARLAELQNIIESLESEDKKVVTDLQAKLDEAKAKVADLNTKHQRALERASGLERTISEQESRIAEAKKRETDWERRFEESETTRNWQSGSISALKTQVADTRLQHDQAVRAWNTLLEYLNDIGFNRKSGTASVERKAMRKYVSDLGIIVQQVPGMAQQISN